MFEPSIVNCRVCTLRCVDYWNFRWLLFTIVCQDKLGIQSGVVSTLDVIRLNMTCGAANGYLCLSLCCEKRLEVIFGMLGVHCLN